jgi:hypothetical protein
MTAVFREVSGGIRQNHLVLPVTKEPVLRCSVDDFEAFQTAHLN